MKKQCDHEKCKRKRLSVWRSNLEDHALTCSRRVYGSPFCDCGAWTREVRP